MPKEPSAIVKPTNQSSKKSKLTKSRVEILRDNSTCFPVPGPVPDSKKKLTLFQCIIEFSNIKLAKANCFSR